MGDNVTVIEIMARAIEGVVDYPDRAEDVVQAVITAIEQSGHAIVPIEPTEAMIDAGYNSEDCDGWSGPISCWERMIQAGKVKQ